MKKIKVAIVGVGNCAKSLVEGVSFYKDDMSDDINGLMLTDIGGYKAGDIEFAVAWDIDKRKVGLPISEAIKQLPNCAITIKEDASDVCSGVVRHAPQLDGMGPMMIDQFPIEERFDPIGDVGHDNFDLIVSILRDLDVDILLNYLPVGSEDATRFWMECALKAKVNVVNCIPVFIASDVEWEQKFIDVGLTIIGDDMRSQFGASIVSAVLQELLFTRGHKVTMHYQDNVGGNTDFGNMQDLSRLRSKKISKENVIKNQNRLHNKSVERHTIAAGPAQYFKALGDNKRAHWLIKAEGFGGAPIEFTADLSVCDSPNSAGVVIDAIRLCKVASEMGIVGTIHGGSAATQKTPAIDMGTALAKSECVALANRELTNFTKVQLQSKNPNALKLKDYFERLVANMIKQNSPKSEDLPWTFQSNKTDYE